MWILKHYHLLSDSTFLVNEYSRHKQSAKNSVLSQFWTLITFLTRPIRDTTKNLEAIRVQWQQKETMLIKFGTVVHEKSSSTWCVPRFLGFWEITISRQITQKG